MANDPIILFDGSCDLCSRSMQFIINHHSDGINKFIPLQTNLGKSIIAKQGNGLDSLESVILIEGSRCLTKSDALIRISSQLPGRWGYLSILSIIPKPIRDAVYDLIAKNRYKWFGQHTS